MYDFSSKHIYRMQSTFGLSETSPNFLLSCRSCREFLLPYSRIAQKCYIHPSFIHIASFFSSCLWQDFDYTTHYQNCHCTIKILPIANSQISSEYIANLQHQTKDRIKNYNTLYPCFLPISRFSCLSPRELCSVSWCKTFHTLFYNSKIVTL